MNTVPKTSSFSSAGALDPVKLKVKSGIYNGATGFFRNRIFADVFAKTVHDINQEDISIFMHACSVGAEPYSIAIQSKLDPQLASKTISIHATDINPEFITHAKNAIYPTLLLKGFTPKERLFTKDVINKENAFVLDDQIKRSVTFKPAQSITEYAPDMPYDVTFMMNVLCYLTPQEQTEVILNAAKHTKHIMCLTAFHPDTVANDIQAAGFKPVTDKQEEIHYGWKDRLRTKNLPAPGDEHYAWKLGEYDASRNDATYRYGAIFIRQ